MQSIVKYIFFVLLYGHSFVYSQSMDSVAFDMHTDTLYYQKETSPSTLQSKTVGDELLKSPGLFLRNSTQGGIQTISAQGLHAQHVQVLWNDIPVNSGMLGVSDLSLFSIGYKQEITYNIQGQEWTTGGIAGIVNIKDLALNNTGYSFGIQQSVGSFGQSLTKFFHQGNHRSHHWSITGGFERATNDFEYLDYTVYPQKKKNLTNSEYNKWYVYPKWEWNINDKNTLKIFQEVLSSHRQIPPFLVTPNNLSDQSDLVARQSMKWNYESQNYLHTLQAAFVYSMLEYNDYVLKQESNNQEQMTYLRYAGTWKWNHIWKLNFGSDVKNTTVKTQNYSRQLNEIGWDVHTSVIYQPQLKLQLKGLIKHTFRTNLGHYFPYLLELNSYLGKRHSWKLWMKNSMDIRYPTLNDRYWEPGGRLDLLPEKSINTSLGSSVQYSIGNHWISNSRLEFFANRLDDLILWMPTNRGYAQPINIGKVLAYGGTWSQNFRWLKSNHSMDLNFSYGFNRSGNMEKRFQSDRSQWVQLPYFPIHSGKFIVEYAWKTLKFNIDGQMYSKRLVTRDGDTYVPSYYLLNSSISYAYPFNKWNIEGKLSLNNIANERYEEVKFRPMPGRNFLFTILINWKHEKN